MALSKIMFYSLENIGVSEIWRTPSKLGFPSFFFKGVMKPCFRICGDWPNSVILLQITDKDAERKSLKALIRGNGISKGQTIIFCSFPIFLSIGDGDIEGKADILYGH